MLFFWNQPWFISRAKRTSSFDQTLRSSKGAMSSICRIFPSSDMKAMESGMRVLCIQKLRRCAPDSSPRPRRPSRRSGQMKTLPSSPGSSSLFMRPTLRESGSLASSTWICLPSMARGTLSPGRSTRCMEGLPPQPAARRERARQGSARSTMVITGDLQEIESDVQGRRRMGQCARGDTVHPGTSHRAQGPGVDAARGLEERPPARPGPELADRLLHHLELHVIEDDQVRPGIDRIPELLQGLDLDR